MDPYNEPLSKTRYYEREKRYACCHLCGVCLVIEESACALCLELFSLQVAEEKARSLSQEVLARYVGRGSLIDAVSLFLFVVVWLLILVRGRQRATPTAFLQSGFIRVRQVNNVIRSLNFLFSFIFPTGPCCCFHGCCSYGGCCSFFSGCCLCLLCTRYGTVFFCKAAIFV